jgi:hypothetical protein
LVQRIQVCCGIASIDAMGRWIPETAIDVDRVAEMGDPLSFQVRTCYYLLRKRRVPRKCRAWRKQDRLVLTSSGNDED